MVPYLPGRGRRTINKARGLSQWPTLHLVGTLTYHLPKWENERRNLWQRNFGPWLECCTTCKPFSLKLRVGPYAMLKQHAFNILCTLVLCLFVAQRESQKLFFLKLDVVSRHLYIS